MSKSRFPLFFKGGIACYSRQDIVRRVFDCRFFDGLFRLLPLRFRLRLEGIGAGVDSHLDHVCPVAQHVPVLSQRPASIAHTPGGQKTVNHPFRRILSHIVQQGAIIQTGAHFVYTMREVVQIELNPVLVVVVLRNLILKGGYLTFQPGNPATRRAVVRHSSGPVP